MFGADQEDVRTTVISAVKALAESRRVDSNGLLLRSPINVHALLGLNGDNGDGGVRLLAPPTHAPEPEVRTPCRRQAAIIERRLGTIWAEVGGTHREAVERQRG